MLVHLSHAASLLPLHTAARRRPHRVYRIRHVHMHAHGISMGAAPAAQLSPPYNLVRRSNYLQGACLRTHTAVNSISGPWFEALVRRREQLARYKGRNTVANGTATVPNRHAEVPMAATRLTVRPADIGPNRRCKAPGATEPSPCVGSLSHATRRPAPSTSRRRQRPHRPHCPDGAPPCHPVQALPPPLGPFDRLSSPFVRTCRPRTVSTTVCLALYRCPSVG